MLILLMRVKIVPSWSWLMFRNHLSGCSVAALLMVLAIQMLVTHILNRKKVVLSCPIHDVQFCAFIDPERKSHEK